MDMATSAGPKGGPGGATAEGPRGMGALAQVHNTSYILAIVY